MMIPRPMKYLTTDTGLLHLPDDDGPPSPCIALHFDNQAGRSDDLISILITPEEGIQLMDRLIELLTFDECGDDEQAPEQP